MRNAIVNIITVKKMCLCLFGTLLTVLIFNSCSAQQRPNRFSVSCTKDKITLPLTYRSGANPLIEVSINGKGPFKFMFDTGSPGLLKIDVETFNSLGLVTVDSVLAGDGSGANSRYFPTTVVDELELADFNIKNADAMVRNYNTRKGIDSIDGVIGLDFFKGYTLELNFENNQLVVSKSPLKVSDKNVIHFKLAESGVPSIETTLGDVKIEPIFDTGNMGGLTLPSSLVTKEMMLSEPRTIGQARTVSNTFEIKEVQLNNAFALGNVIFEKPVVVMNDVLPTINCGIRLLKQMNIVFDLKNNLMALSKFEMKPQNTSTNEYTGIYGDRNITVGPDGNLYVQRPGGMLLKMILREKDNYGLEIVPGAEIVFIRDKSNKVNSLKVKRPDGQWEVAERNI